MKLWAIIYVFILCVPVYMIFWAIICIIYIMCSCLYDIVSDYIFISGVSLKRNSTNWKYPSLLDQMASIHAIPGNYCLVSLTSVIGKMMECVIKDSRMYHMMDHNLFCEKQHGIYRDTPARHNYWSLWNYGLGCWIVGPYWRNLLGFKKSFWYYTSPNVIEEIEGIYCNW